MHRNIVLLVGVLFFDVSSIYAAPSSVKPYTYVNFNEVGRGRYQFEHVSTNLKQQNEDDVAIETETRYEFGWYTQRVKVLNKLPDETSAYLLGFTETFSVIKQVYSHWKNTWGSLCDPKYPSLDCMKLKNVLQSQIDFSIKMALDDLTDSSHQLLLGLWQLKGAADAFNNYTIGRSEFLTHEYLRTLREDVFSTFIIAVSGDLPDLVTKLNLESLTGKVQRLQITANAVIHKTTVGSSNMVFTHISKSHYLQTLKIMKSVSLPWVHRYNYKQGRPLAGANMKYSTYPGALSSLDDFYQTDYLVVMKSANEDMWNKENPSPLFARTSNNFNNFPVLNETVPTALRAMMALRLENDNVWWNVRFTHYPHLLDSSTWLVFRKNGYDTKTGELEAQSLSISEISGKFVYIKDITDDFSETGRWIQYGIPYFDNVYATLGYEDMSTAFGRYFSKSGSPIGKILARDVDASYNIDILRANLRNNNFMSDKYAKCACKPPYSASLAASPRADLNEPFGKYGNVPWLDYRLTGAIDYKSVGLAEPNKILIQAGPPTRGARLPPFSWTKIQMATPDELPDTYDFQPFRTEL